MNYVFETEIGVDPDVPLVLIVRDCAAPRSEVFRAHTDPDLVVHWNRPNGTVMARLTATSLVGSFAQRDALVATGTEHGVRESCQRVDAVLGGIE